MAKKKILTEDAFNASGSTHVDETILNENGNGNTELTKDDTVEDEKITSEDVITKDDINNNDDIINTTNDESNIETPVVEDDTKLTTDTETVITPTIDDNKDDEIIKNNDDIKDDDSTKDDTVEDETVVENDNKVLEPTVSVNVTSKETLTKYEYGFNDEAAYIK